MFLCVGVVDDVDCDCCCSVENRSSKTVGGD